MDRFLTDLLFDTIQCPNYSDTHIVDRKTHMRKRNAIESTNNVSKRNNCVNQDNEVSASKVSISRRANK